MKVKKPFPKSRRIPTGTRIKDFFRKTPEEKAEIEERVKASYAIHVMSLKNQSLIARRVAVDNDLSVPVVSFIVQKWREKPIRGPYQATIKPVGYERPMKRTDYFDLPLPEKKKLRADIENYIRSKQGDTKVGELRKEIAEKFNLSLYLADYFIPSKASLERLLMERYL